MRVSLIFLILVCAMQVYGNSWGVEGAFGTGHMQIENPDDTRAVSEGYSGFLTLQHAFTGNENYSLGARTSFGYGEFENKANNDALFEETRLFTVGLGLEINIYRVFVGVDYTYNNMTIDTAGVLNEKTNATLWAPQFFVGLDVPLHDWNFRVYYMKSQGDISRDDSSLSEDSPVSREGVWIALRYNFNKPDRLDAPARLDEDSYESPRRPTRYFSRPSRSFGRN